MAEILRCAKCGRFTLKQKCTQCGTVTQSVIPPKAKIDDRWGEYRRKYKKSRGLLSNRNV